ncbi:HAMP domain-containing sensor histidine kinase [Sphaerisporangium rubeum]|uniref:histidine kinase n=2 Tax=Sphaerisporangium rubeum TaxID=321317 RepID=A0A7X0M7E8_9ACTN|nr:signal transduction histidine kinase [Sphaerisporangium rubeum]
MSEERDGGAAPGTERPRFSAPQPLIVPPGDPVPVGGSPDPVPASVSRPPGGDDPARGIQGPAAAGGLPMAPMTNGPERPAPQDPGRWRSEQPTVESPHAGRRPRSAPPAPGGLPVWDGPPPVAPRPVRPELLSQLRQLPGRMSIRARLTLTYGALFFAAGALLLFVIYSFVGKAIYDSWPDFPFRLDDVPPEIALSLQERWASFRADTIATARAHLLTRSLMALGGVGILALIFGYVVTDRALRPVQKMTSTARRLSETSLAHERIDLKGPDDELKELADTFDEMLTRLNRAFDAQRRFVDNASHELRTPLAINRTVLEVALADPHASEDLRVLGRTLLGTNARNEHLIEGLLLLARSERELAVRKPVDLRDVGRTVVEQHAAFAEESSVTIQADLRSAPTLGDPVLVERLVANLVENAIKYNIPAGGQLWLRTGMVDGAPVVQVANTGQHVPAYEVDDLFEPFRRLNSDRIESARGAGLGLSIVRAVVRAHRGTIKAVPRDGGGLVMTVRLPAG